MKKAFTADDLPLVKGRIYHLDLAPEELARDVIVVGDPDRVPLLAERFLSRKEVDRSHRGFRSVTGVAGETGRRVSLITTGIGAPSTEIVLNELAALNELDFRTMARKTNFDPLNVIRVGTSGGLSPVTSIGSLVFTDYVIGLDNTAVFYDVSPVDDVCMILESEAVQVLERCQTAAARFRYSVRPYAARADRTLLQALQRQAAALQVPHRTGITISSPGFFAEQGRGVARIPSTFDRMVAGFAGLATGKTGLTVENMEMEAGFLLHFLGGLGYRAAAVCAVINRRHDGAFIADYRRQMEDAALIALRAFAEIH